MSIEEIQKRWNGIPDNNPTKRDMCFVLGELQAARTANAKLTEEKKRLEKALSERKTEKPQEFATKR